MSPEDLRPWIAPLGRALVHFAWQGVAVALIAWAAMTLSRSVRVRYSFGFAGIVGMLACPIATLAWIGPDARPVLKSVDPLPLVVREPARVFIGETPRAGPPAKRIASTMRVRLDRAAPALVATWLVGVALLATRHVVGLAQLTRLRRRATAIVDAAWLDRVRQLSARLRLRARVGLLLTDRLDCPAVVGALRPAILWPAAAITGLTPAQIDSLLAHELAHVRRHDYAANLVQTLVETLLFYHPAVWWLSRRVRQEREHCCDDLAASVVGDRATYAGALAAMETLRRSSPTFAMSARGGSLLMRVQRLLVPTTTRRLSPVGLGLIVTTLVLAGVFACRPREPVAATATTRAATTQATSQPASAAFDWPTSIDTDVRASCARDPFAKRLLDVRDELAIQLVQAGQTRGAGSPTVVGLRAQIEAIDERLATFANQLNNDLGNVSARRSNADDIRPGDLLRVTISDLVGPGVQSVEWKRVERGGVISLPYVGRVDVAYRPASDAEEVIRASYRAEHVLDQPNVGVLVVQDASGRALVPTELLATAGNVANAMPATPEPAPVASPPAERTWTDAQLKSLAASDATLQWQLAQREEAQREIARVRHSDGYGSGTLPFVQRTLDDVNAQIASRLRELTRADSPLIALRRRQADRQELVDALAAATREHGESSDEALAVRGALTRFDAKFAEESGLVGEYYISGTVARPGVYSLTARKITIAQAMVSAGGAATAVPDEDPAHDFGIDVVRRDPADGKETRTRVRWSDVTHDKLGTFYLLPNDQVLVGVGGHDATTAPAATPTTAPTTTVPTTIAPTSSAHDPRALASIHADMVDAIARLSRAGGRNDSSVRRLDEERQRLEQQTADLARALREGRSTAVTLDPESMRRLVERSLQTLASGRSSDDGMPIVAPRPNVVPMPTARPPANGVEGSTTRPAPALDGLRVDRVYGELGE